MKPRTAELSLVIFGVIIAFGVAALNDLARGPSITADTIRMTLILTAIVTAGHIAIRRFAPAADPVLFGIAVALAGVGIGMIRRLDPRLASAQLGWIAIGVVALILTIALLRDHRVIQQYRYSLMLAGIVLLLLPLLPGIGTTLGRSARLWIQLGPITFQPAEAAKVVLAMFLAGYLAERREVMTLASARIGPVHIPAPRHFGPLLLAWGLSLAVMFYERDLGSSMLFFALFVVMVYAATSRAAYAVAGMGLAVAGVYFAYHTFAHVQVRVAAWLDPWTNDPVSGVQAAGRQIAQSYMALGSGGMTGTGIGRGHPELIDPGLRSGTLPTDFIFAAIGEELGMLGAVAILLLFALAVGRGLHIALRSRDEFGTLLATGITVIFGLQACLIMGGVTRLLPLTGITLPFVSYGGSSLLANFVLVALLLRISDSEAVT